MRTPGNKNKFRTDLHAYQIRELKLFVQMSVKVLHHRYGVSSCNLETSISGALRSQSPDKMLSIGVMCAIWSGDPEAVKESLQTLELAAGKPARSESVWLPTFTKKIQAKRD